MPRTKILDWLNSHASRGLVRRRHHIVEGARGGLEVAFRIAILCIIRDLIFQADYVVLALRRPLVDGISKATLDTLFERLLIRVVHMRSDEQMVLDPVFYSAISGGRDASVEHQLKNRQTPVP